MKTLTIILLLIIPAFTLNAFGEKRIKGTGNISTVQREIGTFDELKVSNGIQVVLTQGAAKPLTLEMEDNLIPYIETTVKENTLVIRVTPGKQLQATKAMKVLITVPVLKEIEANSAARVVTSDIWKGEKMDIDASSAADIDLNLELSELDIEISSAARVTLTGDVVRLKADATSASSVDANGLKARHADLEASSAANISVSVIDEIKYEASSAARINYYGTPRVISSEVSSGGSVKQKNALK